MRLQHIGTLWVLALCLSAQERARPGFIRSHPLLSALDRDKDGVISSAELRNAPEVLAILDTNKDGSVTPEEMRPAGFARGPDSGPGESRPPEASEMVKALMAFDADGDGRLSNQEVPERMWGLFERADTDKDGVLTAAELTKLAESEVTRVTAEGSREGRGGRGQRRMRMDPVMAALDTNHDGMISPSEIRNSVAALKTLDKNGDGQITEDEVQAAFGAGREDRVGREPRQ